MSVEATVVIDNFCQQQGLLSEWGYSLHLATPAGDLLWDTGGFAHILEHNLSVLNIDPARLSDIALSHGHFDHCAGLMDVVRLAPQAKLWAAKGIETPRRGDADQQRNCGGGALFSASSLFHRVNGPTRINAFVTAITVPLSARDPRFLCQRHMWEQRADGSVHPDTFEDDMSLVIQTDKGASLLLGCAHAGLPNILHYAQQALNINAWYMVVGGTHLSAVEQSELPSWLRALKHYRVAHWRVNHCTGFKAAAELFRSFDDVDWAGAGARLSL